MKRLCLIILFLASPVWAAQIEITSLPFGVTTPEHDNDTLYFTQDLSASDTGMTFEGGVHDVYLRGAGYKLTYNTDEEDSRYGIIFFSAYGNMTRNIKIDSLTIEQYSKVGHGCNGVAIKDGIKNVQFYDCNVHPKGPDTRGIYQYSTELKSFNIEIRGGNYTSFVDSFTSRCSNDAASILLGYATDDSGGYQSWVHNIVIDSCPHTGVLVYGRSYVDSCTLWGNAHNDQYDLQGVQGCFSADNPYLIGLGFASPGSRVSHNTIRNRSSYEGGRGIIISQAHATAENPLLIHDNDIIVTNGPSDYSGARDASRGLRLREGGTDWPTWDLKHIRIYNNYVEVRSDTLSSTTHIGSEAAALEMMNFRAPTTGVWIYNNTFVAIADSDNCADGWNHTLAFTADGDSFGTDLQSYDNHFISNGACIGLHTMGPNWGVGNWTFTRDTLEWLSPWYACKGMFKGVVLVGFSGAYAINNIIRDPIYIGYDGDLDSNAMRSSGVGTQKIHHEKTVTITVNGNDALPVEDAEVLIINGLVVPDTVLDSTNVSGQVSTAVKYDYDQWINSVRDSLIYNDFTFVANKAGDSTSGTYTVAWDRGDTTLVLSATGGNGVTATRIKGWRP